MDAAKITQITILTLGLTIGLLAIVGSAFRMDIAANWNEQRCEPHVIPLAGFFKPTEDPRSAAEFATENWNFCQKKFVEAALSVAAQVPKGMTAASAASVSVIQDIANVGADIFFHLWKFCYGTYTSFMERMKGVAKLFQNFIVNLYSITERLNASALSIVYSLISLVTAFVNSIQVTLIAAIVVIGIILVLQILLFFVLLPISGLIVTVTVLVASSVVAVATAIAASMVAELFSPGACFAKGTLVYMKDRTMKPIESVVNGDLVYGGGRVTATHTFRTTDRIYKLNGVRVTGDHLVYFQNMRIPVHEHPEAILEPSWTWSLFSQDYSNDLWCLTTTSRIIPCISTHGYTRFADWEEIEIDDIATLKAWYNSVWSTLNPYASLVPTVTDKQLDTDAGLSPDCMVASQDWLGRMIYVPIRDLRIGQTVYDSPTTTTKIIGKLRLEGDHKTDAVELPGRQLVTGGTWVCSEKLWTLASGPVCELHPMWWEHLYTESGSFMIQGSIKIRDASEVGLGNLRPLVESVVLNNQGINDSGYTI